MKLAYSAHSRRLSQAFDMLLDQSAILALENTKYCKEVVSPLLIWTLPVHCRNFFSLFKFVLVRSSLCLLTTNFDTESITQSPFIWHGLWLYFEICGDPYRASLEIAFQKNVKHYKKDRDKHVVFEEFLIKKSIWKLSVFSFAVCYMQE